MLELVRLYLPFDAHLKVRDRQDRVLVKTLKLRFCKSVDVVHQPPEVTTLPFTKSFTEIVKPQTRDLLGGLGLHKANAIAQRLDQQLVFDGVGFLQDVSDELVLHPRDLAASVQQQGVAQVGHFGLQLQDVGLEALHLLASVQGRN